jgi:transaldolase
MSSLLDQLSQYSSVVCDTGSLPSIALYQPDDATTNPSILYNEVNQWVKDPSKEVKGIELLREAIQYGKTHAADQSKQAQLQLAIDRLFVNVGTEISKIVKGYVSTEVDST